ncbi:MAG: Hsp20/alpha crystallin family protein [Gammaproteobacteria bacterium]
MTQALYQPWQLFDQFEQAGRHLFGGNSLREDVNQENQSWSPRVDIQETDSSYIIYADIPGVDPADIELSLEKNVLTLSGKRDSYDTDECDAYKRIERSYGVFSRKFTLPDSVDSETVSAKSEHGVLTVTIPKREKPQAKRITVNA